ncbi:hypothetical protein PAXRUDRAFT_46299, partial [Paxillus rubicundulus Ve08.2h10]
SCRPTRSRRLPARFRDVLPEPPPPFSNSEANTTAKDVLLEPPPPDPESTQVPLPRIILHVFDSLRTPLNKFGIGREYRHRPSYDPDALLTVEQLASTAHYAVDNIPWAAKFFPMLPPWPFKNMSIWRLMTWKMSGSANKSEAEVTHLVNDVLLAKDFSLEELQGFNAHTETKHFDA